MSWLLCLIASSRLGFRVPSTSAQIPQWLHRKLSGYLAREQAHNRDHPPTKLSFTSAAVLALPTEVTEIVQRWEQCADALTLKRRSNPGVKRPIQLTDEAHQRLLELYATCVEHDTGLQKQHLLSLALHESLKEA